LLCVPPGLALKAFSPHHLVMYLTRRIFKHFPEFAVYFTKNFVYQYIVHCEFISEDYEYKNEHQPPSWAWDAIRKKYPQNEELTYGFSFMTMLPVGFCHGFLIKEQCDNTGAFLTWLQLIFFCYHD
jgi:hypothetical protein